MTEIKIKLSELLSLSGLNKHVFTSEDRYNIFIDKSCIISYPTKKFVKKEFLEKKND